jgi:hypothetical protein
MLNNMTQHKQECGSCLSDAALNHGNPGMIGRPLAAQDPVPSFHGSNHIKQPRQVLGPSRCQNQNTGSRRVKAIPAATNRSGITKQGITMLKTINVHIPPAALAGSMRDFRVLSGSNLLQMAYQSTAEYHGPAIADRIFR